MNFLLEAAIEDFPLMQVVKAVLSLYYRFSWFVLSEYGMLLVVFVSLTIPLLQRCYGRRRLATKKQINKIIMYGISLYCVFTVAMVSMKIPLADRSKFVRLDCMNSSKGGKIVGGRRDCDFTRGALCTKEEPCTPCNIEQGMDATARNAVENMELCQPCEANNVLSSSCGEFVDGVGPYCIYQGDYSITVLELEPAFKIRPCNKCCREPPGSGDRCRNRTQVRNVTKYNFALAKYEVVPENATYFPHFAKFLDELNATDDPDRVCYIPPTFDSNKARVISQNLDLTGMTLSQALGNRSKILQSIATSLGVNSSQVNITNMTEAQGRRRSLLASKVRVSYLATADNEFTAMKIVYRMKSTNFTLALRQELASSIGVALNTISLTAEDPVVTIVSGQTATTTTTTVAPTTIAPTTSAAATTMVTPDDSVQPRIISQAVDFTGLTSNDINGNHTKLAQAISSSLGVALAQVNVTNVTYISQPIVSVATTTSVVTTTDSLGATTTTAAAAATTTASPETTTSGAAATNTTTATAAATTTVAPGTTTSGRRRLGTGDNSTTTTGAAATSTASPGTTSSGSNSSTSSATTVSPAATTTSGPGATTTSATVSNSVTIARVVYEVRAENKGDANVIVSKMNSSSFLTTLKKHVAQLAGVNETKISSVAVFPPTIVVLPSSQHAATTASPTSSTAASTSTAAAATTGAATTSTASPGTTSSSPGSTTISSTSTAAAAVSTTTGAATTSTALPGTTSSSPGSTTTNSTTTNSSSTTTSTRL